MTGPRFSPNENVLHDGKRAVVIECINLSSPEDVDAQGFRYYVSHSRRVWSVPESALSLFPTSRPIK